MRRSEINAAILHAIKTIVGEVSSVNDDTADNVFLKVPKRFTEIQEDEPPKFLLCGDLNGIC